MSSTLSSKRIKTNFRAEQQKHAPELVAENIVHMACGLNGIMESAHSFTPVGCGTTVLSTCTLALVRNSFLPGLCL